MSPTMPKIEEGLRNALHKLTGSPRVTALDYMINVDAQGEEYLLVYAILHDDDASPVPPREQLAGIEGIIRDELEKQMGLWVSVRFRSSAEQQHELDRRSVVAKPRRVSAA